MSGIAQDFYNYCESGDVDVEGYLELVDRVFDSNISSVMDQYTIVCHVHSLLLRITQKNEAGEILQPFDSLYNGLMDLRKRVSDESRGDLRWLYITPFIREIRDEVRSASARDRFIYTSVARNLLYVSTVKMDFSDWISYEDFLGNSKLFVNNIMNVVAPSVPNIDHSDYPRLLNELSNIIPPYENQQYKPKTILVITNSCSADASDELAYSPFVPVMVKRGYKVDMFIEVVREPPSYVDNLYVMGKDEMPGKYTYDYVFLATHNTPMSAYALARNVGKKYINLLGHICAGFPGENVWNVVPKWDDPKNYSGKPILCPGMACGIRSGKGVSSVKPDLPHIVFPYTGYKFNNLSIRIIHEVVEKLGEIPYEATILIGNQDNINVIMPILKLMLGELGNRWRVVMNDNDAYWEAMRSATVVVGSYPYNGYATVLDALCLGKPFINQYSPDSNGHQCSYRILKMFNLEFGCFLEREDVVNEVVKFVEDEEYADHYTGRFTAIQRNLDEICAVHNEALSREFDKAIDEIE